MKSFRRHAVRLALLLLRADAPVVKSILRWKVSFFMQEKIEKLRFNFLIKAEPVTKWFWERRFF